MMRHLLLVALIVGYAGHAADAQDLQIDFKQPIFRVVSDPVSISVTVANVAAPKRFDVLSATISLPRELIAGARENSVPCVINGFDEFDLDSAPKTCTAAIPAVGVGETWGFLSYRSQPYPLTLRIRYQNANGEEEPRDVEQTLMIEPRAPVQLVLLGAWIGVCFVVGFRCCYALARGKPVPSASTAGVNLALGWLAVTAAGVALRFSPELVRKLGVSFEINDIVGGAVLGLAFEPLTKKLAQLIGDEPPASSDGPAHAPSPSSPPAPLEGTGKDSVSAG